MLAGVRVRVWLCITTTSLSLLITIGSGHHRPRPTYDVMRIGCDLDGVIVDHRKNQQKLLARRGFGVPKNNLHRDYVKNLLPPDDYRSFKSELYGEMSLGADEIKGSSRVLRDLASRGHDIHIISHRHIKSELAMRWLEERGYTSFIPSSKIHFVSPEVGKETVCKRLDIFLHIDDHSFILESLETPRHKILFGKYAAPHPAVTSVAKNWPELLRLISKIA